MASYMTYKPGDRMVTSMPFFWVGGLVTSLLASSYCGTALICPPSRKDADVIASTRGHEASHVIFWLPQLSALFAAEDAAGHLYFEGRKGDMVKSAGVNIAPAEVEAAIAKIDGINESAVLGVPLGGGEEELVAAIVMHNGAKLDAEAISKILRANLSAYKIPKKYYFLSADEIPRTASDKVQRPVLRSVLSELST